MTRKVLIADDEERIRGLVVATLGSDERYEVLTAADGAAAVSICQTERPEVLFLDLLMPKMDGYAVCRALKG
ncbi:MAG: response regulator, partial [Chloroflexi bacterium]|nr:response regulator [Chloroflexota bacterium]